jgi:anti-anti-sigma factor
MADLTIAAAPIRELPNSCEVIIGGPVSANEAPQLKRQVDRALGPRITFVSVLMKHVSYMNSSGLGYLIDLSTLLERRGGALVLVEVQPKVKVLFSNLGMNRYFRFEASDETARAFLRAQAERLARSPRVIPLDGGDEGVEFPVVGAAIRIGSDTKATIPVRHAQVEPRHAEVYRTGDQCFVKDLGSRFGTFLGDRKIADEPLKAGDVIKIGNIRLAYYPAGVKRS